MYINKSWMSDYKLLPIVFLEGAYDAGGNGGYFCSVLIFFKKVNSIYLKYSSGHSLHSKTERQRVKSWCRTQLHINPRLKGNLKMISNYLGQILFSGEQELRLGITDLDSNVGLRDTLYDLEQVRSLSFSHLC